MFDSQSEADLLPCGHTWAHKQCIDKSSAPLSTICNSCNGTAGMPGTRTGAQPQRNSRTCHTTAPIATGASAGGHNGTAAGGSSSSNRPLCGDSSSTRTSSAYESDLLDLLTESGAVGPTEATDVCVMIRELMEQQLLPQRRVGVSTNRAGGCGGLHN